MHVSDIIPCLLSSFGSSLYSIPTGVFCDWWGLTKPPLHIYVLLGTCWVALKYLHCSDHSFSKFSAACCGYWHMSPLLNTVMFEFKTLTNRMACSSAGISQSCLVMCVHNQHVDGLQYYYSQAISLLHKFKKTIYVLNVYTVCTVHALEFHTVWPYYSSEHLWLLIMNV